MNHAGDRLCSSPRRLLGAVVALTVFATAFGYVEGAVVVYLREIGHPQGFRFPLQPLPPRLILTEVAREAAAIFLLLGVAFACEREGYRRFAVFAFCFGVWDLAYYLYASPSCTSSGLSEMIDRAGATWVSPLWKKRCTPCSMTPIAYSLWVWRSKAKGGE